MALIEKFGFSTNVVSGESSTSGGGFGGSGVSVNNYVKTASFNAANGVLTLTREGLSDLSTSLDGRYAQSADLDNVAYTNVNNFFTADQSINGVLTVTDGTDETRMQYDGLRFDRSISYARPTTNGTKSLYMGGSTKGQYDWNSVNLFSNTFNIDATTTINGSLSVNAGAGGVLVSSSGAYGITITQDTAASGQSGRLFFENDTVSEGISLMNSVGRLQMRGGASYGSSSGTVFNQFSPTENIFSVDTTINGGLTVNGTLDVNGRVRFIADQWNISSGDSAQRLFFAFNSHTYIKAPADIILRPSNGGVDVFRLSSSSLTITCVYNGNGSGLTDLNGTQITTGTVDDARIDSALTGKSYNGVTIKSGTSGGNSANKFLNEQGIYTTVNISSSYRGGIDPATDNLDTFVPIAVGDFWFATATGTLSVGATSLNVNEGDQIIANTDMTVAGDVVNTKFDVYGQQQVPSATETMEGKIRIATNSEVLAGTLSTVAVAPSYLKSNYYQKSEVDAKGWDLYLNGTNQEKVIDGSKVNFADGTGLTFSYNTSTDALSATVSLSPFDTDDLSEGSNLYYTTTRANSAIDARVTKAFVDALGVDAATLDGAVKADFEPANTNIQAHISSTSNPHSVTATQVGLGNVDNTSDLNKPISTATQTALDGKEGTISAGTTSDYYRGDKTFQDLDSAIDALGYIKSQSDSQTLSWDSSQGELSISGGNTVDLDGRYVRTSAGGTDDIITNYVPYTGATQTVNLNTQDFIAGGGLFNGRVTIEESGANSQISLRTSGVLRGSVYVNSSNQVGFLDGDGQWAYRISKDSAHEWLSNNTVRMILSASGELIISKLNSPIIDSTGSLSLKTSSTNRYVISSDGNHTIDAGSMTYNIDGLATFNGNVHFNSNSGVDVFSIGRNADTSDEAIKITVSDREVLFDYVEDVAEATAGSIRFRTQLADGSDLNTYSFSDGSLTVNNSIIAASGAFTGNVSGANATASNHFVTKSQLDSFSPILPSNIAYTDANNNFSVAQTFQSTVLINGQIVTSSAILQVNGFSRFGGLIYIHDIANGVNSPLGNNNGTLTWDGNALLTSASLTNVAYTNVDNQFSVEQDFVGGLRSNIITCRTGQQLVLNAGESAAYATGQVNEFVYINAETGIQINASPDNWASGWAGRITHTIGGTVDFNAATTVNGSFVVNGTGLINSSSGEALRLQSPSAIGNILIRFEDSSGSDKGYVGYGSSLDDGLSLFNQITGDIDLTTTSGDILIRPNNSTRATFSSTGLDVAGTISSSGNASFGDTLDLNSSLSASSSRIRLYDQNSSLWTIGSGINANGRLSILNATTEILEITSGLFKSNVISEFTQRININKDDEGMRFLGSDSFMSFYQDGTSRDGFIAYIGSSGATSGYFNYRNETGTSHRFDVGTNQRFSIYEDSVRVDGAFLSVDSDTAEAVRVKSPNTTGNVYISFKDSADANKAVVGFSSGLDDTFNIINQETGAINITTTSGLVNIRPNNSLVGSFSSSGLNVAGSVTATTLVKSGATSDDILLGDGTTTSLSAIQDDISDLEDDVLLLGTGFHVMTAYDELVPNNTYTRTGTIVFTAGKKYEITLTQYVSSATEWTMGVFLTQDSTKASQTNGRRLSDYVTVEASYTSGIVFSKTVKIIYQAEETLSLYVMAYRLNNPNTQNVVLESNQTESLDGETITRSSMVSVREIPPLM